MLRAFSLLSLNLSAEAHVSLPTGYAPAAKDAASATIALNDLALHSQLNENTTPEPKEALSKTVTIAGAITIDLTDAPIVGAVDGSGNPTDGESLAGHKAFLVAFVAPSTNVAAVNIAPGASNAYALFGAGNDIDVLPGSTLIYYVADDTLPTVAAGAKDITFSGTNGDKVKILIVFLQP